MDTNYIKQKQQQQHPFDGPLFRCTQVSQYQKGKTNLIVLKRQTVSVSGISWAICNSEPRPRQITTPAPNHSVLPPNQQHQSTEGTKISYEGGSGHNKGEVL